MDIKPLQDLNDVLSDSSVTSILQSIPNLQVITDTQMRDLIAETGKSDYMEVVADLRSRRRLDRDINYPEAFTEYMGSFRQSFMDVLKKHHPTLHDHLEIKIERRTQEEHDRFSVISEQPLAFSRAAVVLEEIKKLESSYGINHYDATSKLPELHVLKVPDQSFDKVAHFSDTAGKREHEEILNLIKSPPPGTNQEWAAMITIHELAHLAGNRQKAGIDYFTKVSAEAKATSASNGEDFIGNLIHAKETDADLDMYHALGHLIPSDAMEYWAARRVALQSEQHIARAIERIDNGETGTPDLHVHEGHGSGLFLLEYMQTEEMPDYFNTKTNTSAFFEKTVKYMQDELDSVRKTHETKSFLDEDYRPDPKVFLGAVEQALKSEPPVYTPAEAQIAQNYLYAMHEVLGIEKENFDPKLYMASTQEDPLPPSNTYSTTSVKI